MSGELHDLDAALEVARRPVRPCPLPPAPLRVRLGTSPALRRMLPAAAAVARAQARGRALWDHDPAERARATAAMAAVAGGTSRAGDVQALAREHVVEGRVKEALFWRPWKVQPPDPGARELAAQALQTGRGVLLSTCHIGPYHANISVMARFGRTVYSATGWATETPQAGYWGRRIAHRRSQAAARDERLLRARGSFALLERLLREGEVVSVFFGMPGSRQTMFLGKPVMMSSGSARLAMAAHALVLPLRTRREGHRVHVDIGAPLDSRDHSGPEELQDALAAVHERWILENPAALEDPNRIGAWEGGATAEAWQRGSTVGEPRQPTDGPGARTRTR